MTKVTDMAKYQALRQKPVSAACEWNASTEQMLCSSIGFWFSWYRNVLRTWGV